VSGQAPDMRKDIEPPVAANLRRFQEAAGLSNHDLAEALGHRDDRQITRWRNAHVVPSWETLVELAGVLGVAPADFYIDRRGAAA
jgi:transcriptional regulator with XRE-family HTH domain